MNFSKMKKENLLKSIRNLLDICFQTAYEKSCQDFYADHKKIKIKSR